VTLVRIRFSNPASYQMAPAIEGRALPRVGSCFTAAAKFQSLGNASSARAA
jgi:hypothetical protein